MTRGSVGVVSTDACTDALETQYLHHAFVRICLYHSDAGTILHLLP